MDLDILQKKWPSQSQCISSERQTSALLFRLISMNMTIHFFSNVSWVNSVNAIVMIQYRAVVGDILMNYSSLLFGGVD